jgi:hypothetical protein
MMPPDDRLYLEEMSERMLKNHPVVDAPRPYWDPKLRYNKKEYFKFVKKLHGIEYFYYALEALGTVGVFFEWKSNCTKLRAITDARLANALFEDPPGVQLVTGEGFGRIEDELPDGVMSDLLLRDLRVVLGLSDVKDCFHLCRVPLWLARHFCWDPVPAKLVGLGGSTLEYRVLGPMDAVYPCAGSLRQGFTWSLCFLRREPMSTWLSQSAL